LEFILQKPPGKFKRSLDMLLNSSDYQKIVDYEERIKLLEDRIKLLEGRISDLIRKNIIFYYFATRYLNK